MIIAIKAKFACDQCGEEFSVSIDPASIGAPGWSVFEIAEDAIRGGIGYEDGAPHEPGKVGAVEGNRHLCKECANEDSQETTG